MGSRLFRRAVGVVSVLALGAALGPAVGALRGPAAVTPPPGPLFSRVDVDAVGAPVQGGAVLARLGALDVSDDGRYVLFQSNWSSYPGVPGLLIRKDLDTGVVALVSVSDTGQPVTALWASMSSDGRVVAFTSEDVATADDVDGTGPRAALDVFVRDVTGAHTRLVSSGLARHASAPSDVLPAAIALSADGHMIAFVSDGFVCGAADGPSAQTIDYTPDLFLRDVSALATGGAFPAPTCLTAGAAGAGLNPVQVGRPSLSADGRYAAVTMTAVSLGGTSPQVWRIDRLTRQPQLVSSDAGGAPTEVLRCDPGGQCFGAQNPTISNDGALVTWPSAGTVSGFFQKVAVSVGSPRLVYATPWTTDYSYVSADGSAIIFISGSGLVAGDTNASSDVYSLDTATGQLIRVSESAAGAENLGGVGSAPVAVSGDGRFVVFSGGGVYGPLSTDLNQVLRWDRRVRFPLEPAPVSLSVPAMTVVGGQMVGRLYPLRSDPRMRLAPVQITVLSGPGAGRPANCPLLLGCVLNISGELRFSYTRPAGPGEFLSSLTGTDTIEVRVDLDRDGFANDEPVRRDARWIVPANYVAMGDSYSSGEGVYIDETLNWFTGEPSGDRRCFRSDLAYPRKVTLDGYNGTPIAVAAHGASGLGSFIFDACSGARTYDVDPLVRSRGDRINGTIEPDPQNLYPQYEAEGKWQLDDIGPSPVDLVTLTIGGNDAEFSAILKQCLYGGGCAADDTYRGGRFDAQFAPIRPGVLDGSVPASTLLETAAFRVAQTMEDLKAAGTPDTGIFLLAYPTLFPGMDLAAPGADQARREHYTDCAVVTNLMTPAEEEFLQMATAAFRDVSRMVAEQVGVHYVDVYSGDFLPSGLQFQHHGVCSDDPWLNGLTFQENRVDLTDPLSDTPFKASFHPNRAGQAALGTVLSVYIDDLVRNGAPTNIAGIPLNPAPIAPISSLRSVSAFAAPAGVVSYGRAGLSVLSYPPVACASVSAYPPDTLMQLDVSGFAPDADIEFAFDDGIGGRTVIATYPADVTGSQSVQIVIPGVGDLPSPAVTITATGTAEDGLSTLVASSPLIVVGDPSGICLNPDPASTGFEEPVTLDVLANDIVPGVVEDYVVEPVAAIGVTLDGQQIVVTPPAGFIGVYAVNYRVCGPDGVCEATTAWVNVQPACTITGTDGDDTLTGTPGDDVICANGGADIIDAGAGDDLIFPGDGDDLIDAGSGNDRIVGEGGSDWIEAGPGDDTISYPIGTPSVFGEEGSDHIDAPLADPSKVFTDPIPADGVAPSPADDLAVTAAGETVLIDVLANDVDVDGDLDPTTVQIITGPEHGTAAIVATETATALEYTPTAGYVGDDRVVYQICDTAGHCSQAAVLIHVADPPVAPDAAPDAAFADQGETVTIDVLDNDSDPNGDLAENTLAVVSAPHHATATVTSDAVNGYAITYVPNPGFSGQDAFVYQVCDATSLCSTAVVTVSVGLAGCTIIGTNGPDTLTGTAGPDVICGLDGNDIINAAAGDDVIRGGPGQDALNGGDGNDTIDGGAGADTLTGGSGNDLIFGGRGNDVINSGAGNDTIHAGRGDDNINGGVDDDVITTGSGDDSVTSGAGNDTINGRRGIDTIDGGPGNDIIRGGIGADHLNGGAGADTITGGDGNDIIGGDGGRDELFGNAGADTITGGDGNDRLHGGPGADILDGEAGDDRLWGGPGTDTCTGEHQRTCSP